MITILRLLQLYKNKKRYSKDSFRAFDLETLVVAHINSKDPQEEELRRGYLENLRENLFEIQKLFEKRNFSEIIVFGHRLSGSGGLYGYPEISLTGAEMEAAAISKKPENIEKSIKNLRKIVTQLEI